MVMNPIILFNFTIPPHFPTHPTTHPSHYPTPPLLTPLLYPIISPHKHFEMEDFIQFDLLGCYYCRMKHGDEPHNSFLTSQSHLTSPHIPLPTHPTTPPHHYSPHYSTPLSHPINILRWKILFSLICWAVITVE